jgi:mRNA interferase MazF
LGAPAIGDVILVAFPYSDLSNVKLRPALVIGKAEFNNLILCQITSKQGASKIAIKLVDGDFQNGSLNRVSYARPDKIFTAEPSIIEKHVGSLSDDSCGKVRSAVRAIFE